MSKAKKQELALSVTKEEDFSKWYTEVITKGDLMEYTDVSGCIIFKPNSFQIWEKIQEEFNKKIKSIGVKNAYFPMFIPEKLLSKEEDHIEGFSAEVAWVTKGGGSELKEKLAIRPTSETIIGDAFSKWIKSYRDLPLQLNQWCNVVRWEFKHPTPFMRNREFLWQEGHCAYATYQQAEENVYKILDFYQEIFEDVLAIPVVKGVKSMNEKFAGAEFTTTVESFVVEEGRAIQAGTSHHLGQHFAKAFSIEFLDKDQKKQFPYQTSWGISTRTIGSMVMIHSDNKGLVLPPKVCEDKIVIIPLLFKGKEEIVLDKVDLIVKKLEEFGFIVDDDRKESAGFKFNKWDMRGIPIKVEIGPRDVEKGVVVISARDTSEKREVSIENLQIEIQKELEEMHLRLLEKARKKINDATVEVSNYNDFKKAISQGKRCLVPWHEDEESEDKIKEETGAKSSCKPLDLRDKSLEGVNCFYSGKPATCWIYFCKSF
jgi:prolyl-tRNA synthetase